MESRSLGRLIGGVALAAACSRHASAQSGAPLWVVSPGQPTAVTFVQVTPTTDPAVVARSLAQRPAGQRVISLIGFSAGLTEASQLRVTVPSATAGRKVSGAKARVLSVPSPWLDAGASTVRSRTESWLRRYHASGGTAPDMVVATESVPSSSQAYLQRIGSVGWAAAQSDSRFPGLAAALRIVATQRPESTRMPSAAAWDAYLQSAARTAIDQSVLRPFASCYRTAWVGLSRGPLPVESNSRLIATVEGSSDQLVFLRPGTAVSLDELNQLSKALATMPAGARRVLRVQTIERGMATDALAAWTESLRHACAISGATMIGDSKTETTKIAVGSLLEEARAHGVGAHASVPTTQPRYDPLTIALSGATHGTCSVWRVTCRPGTAAVRFKFEDGAIELVGIDGSSNGAWFSHASTRRVAAVEAADSSTDGPTSVPLLFDRSYSPNPAQAPVGVERYLIVYQTSIDIGSMAAGRIDIDKLVAHIQQRIAESPTPFRWGILDYEVPFDDVLEAGPAHPLHASAVSALVGAIREVKRRFPSIKWTYYNMPRLRYWEAGRDWADLDPTQRITAMDRVLTSYGSIMAEMDWFNPSVYDQYEAALGMPRSQSDPHAAERAFRSSSIELIRRWLATRGTSGHRPIVPMVSCWFQPGGGATVLRSVPLAEFISEQVAPCIAAGADSVALWGCMHYFVQVALMPPEQVPGPCVPDREFMRTVMSADFGISTDSSATSDASAIRNDLLSRMEGAQLERIEAVSPLLRAATRASNAGPSVALR